MLSHQFTANQRELYSAASAICSGGYSAITPTNNFTLTTFPSLRGLCHVELWLYLIDIPSPCLDQHRAPIMAPLPVDDVPPLKRTSSTADFDLPAAKKQQLRPTRHHHKLQWNPDYIARHQTSPQDEEGARVLLARSIVLALEAVGFESADPVAIESFRAEVEECTAQAIVWLATPFADTRRHGQLLY